MAGNSKGIQKITVYIYPHPNQQIYNPLLFLLMTIEQTRKVLHNKKRQFELDAVNGQKQTDVAEKNPDQTSKCCKHRTNQDFVTYFV